MGLFDRIIKRFFGATPTKPGTRDSSSPTRRPLSLKPLGESVTGSRVKEEAPSDLNAADFLPITRAEQLELAENSNLSSRRFERRDLIPLASDERTKAIDRGMVSNGLLTPEQLVEIHRVGAEMDRVRPALAHVNQLASRSGEAAVNEDRERRARLKAEQKAAAAARKRQRADGVAQRHANDIVFLGCGVSRHLGERRSQIDQLASRGLPILCTPADLATALGVSIPRLRWLAFHAEVARRVHYLSFEIPKKSGGKRTISTPHRSLEAAQRWIHANILVHLPFETPAHGFVRLRGTVSNAQNHVGKAVIINMDLEAFFPSITFPRVCSVFVRLGYSPAVATILALLCTECPRRIVTYDGVAYHVATGPRSLPQGACTSPGLSNQVARRLDRRLNGLGAKWKATYTRYADDLTLSGDAGLNERVGYLMARVRHIAEEEGFTINAKKSRVLRRNQAQTVTGLVVNDSLSIGRKEVRRLRSILHHASKEGLDQQNREGRPDFRAWLRGKIAYVCMVQPEQGARLHEQFLRLAADSR